jgi:PTH1 family peptidyl-tRNA hydrolase
MFVSSLARTFSCTLKPESKFFGMTARTTIAGRDVRLLYPTTFMNNSGKAVAAIAQFYKIDVANILVAYDELDLPPGIAKLKVGGSSSQNGIRDIVKALGNQKDFLRLRLGIGHPGHKSRVTGYVLGKAPRAEQDKLDAAIDEAIRATEILIKDDLLSAQQRLHSFSAA